MISVIVPIYNMEKYLSRCIESLLNQTYQQFEILLIDDGSTDFSAKICREYIEKDNRIRYYYKLNGGLSDARNVGLTLAKGEYIAFVDSDDYVHNTYLEHLHSLINGYDADIACCNHMETSLDELILEEKESKISCMSGYEACARVVSDLAPVLTSAWGSLYKLDCVKNIRFPYGRLHEDVATTFKYYLNSNKVVYSDKKLYAYYQRPNSIMHVVNIKKIEDELWAMSERADYLEQMGDKKLAIMSWDFMSGFLVRDIINQRGNQKLWKKYGKLYIVHVSRIKSKLKIWLLINFQNVSKIYSYILKIKRKNGNS